MALDYIKVKKLNLKLKNELYLQLFQNLIYAAVKVITFQLTYTVIQRILNKLT